MNTKIRIMVILSLVISLLIAYFQINNKPLFTVMTYNIASGHKPDGGRNENLIINYLEYKNIGVMGLNEVDINTARSSNRDQLNIISTKLNAKKSFAKSLDYDGGYYGNGLVTQYNILEQKRILLYNLAPCEQRSLLHNVVKIEGVATNVLVTHLEYSSKDVRIHQINQIRNYINSLKGPIILMGDFNTESPLELNVFKEKLNIIYNDPEPVTYPSEQSTLDYILYSKELNLTS